MNECLVNNCTIISSFLIIRDLGSWMSTSRAIFLAHNDQFWKERLEEYFPDTTTNFDSQMSSKENFIQLSATIRQKLFLIKSYNIVDTSSMLPHNIERQPLEEMIILYKNILFKIRCSNAHDKLGQIWVALVSAGEMAHVLAPGTCSKDVNGLKAKTLLELSASIQNLVYQLGHIFQNTPCENINKAIQMLRTADTEEKLCELLEHSELA